MIGYTLDDYISLLIEIEYKGYATIDINDDVDIVIRQGNKLITKLSGSRIINYDFMKVGGTVDVVLNSEYYKLFVKYGRPVKKVSRYAIFGRESSKIYFDMNNNTIVRDPFRIAVIDTIV
jgi:hypothetical protein